MGPTDARSITIWSRPERESPVSFDVKCNGLPWYWQTAAFCFAAALVFSRQPEALLHAQFYAEDGHVWFADAYNFGWFASLFKTQDGYFQTLPRLAAALALPFSLSLAPLIMNLLGLIVQLLPVPILLSRRLRCWGSLSFRALLALAYLALPNCRELNLTVTEAQWHLALIACLLVLSEAPRNGIGRLFDILVFLVCGVTGPFCGLLLPIALLYQRTRQQIWTWAPVALLACGSAIEIYALLFVDSARQHTFPLGATPEGFARILGGQVYLGALLGSNMLGATSTVLPIIGTAVSGTLILAYIGVRTGIEFRLFLLFSGLLFLSSLANPKTGPQYGWTTAWQVLAVAPAVHYWFFPSLAFEWGLISLLRGPRATPLSQAVGILLVPLTLVGFIRDWRHPAYPDVNFRYYVSKLLTSEKGKAVLIPETPPGWTLLLIRK